MATLEQYLEARREEDHAAEQEFERLLEHASPTPWSYHSVPGETAGINRDWIEDDHGNVVVNHVGHIDGPLICAAVNAYMAARGGKA